MYQKEILKAFSTSHAIQSKYDVSLLAQDGKVVHPLPAYLPPRVLSFLSSDAFTHFCLFEWGECPVCPLPLPMPSGAHSEQDSQYVWHDGGLVV